MLRIETDVLHVAADPLDEFMASSPHHHTGDPSLLLGLP